MEALIEFGAVYSCPVPPAPPADLEASLPPGAAEQMRLVREAALLAAAATEKERRNVSWHPAQPAFLAFLALGGNVY